MFQKENVTEFKIVKFKVVLLGEASVGKTAITRRFVKQGFNPGAELIYHQIMALLNVMPLFNIKLLGN